MQPTADKPNLEIGVSLQETLFKVNEDFEVNYETDFDLLIKTAIEIGNSLDGKKYVYNTNDLFYAEGLGQKIINHAITIRQLFGGYQLSIGQITYQATVDFASIAILTRAALETYLTLNYIFVAPKTPEEKLLRFQAWHLAGFLERADHIPTKQAHVDLKNKEQLEIEKLKQELNNSSYFNSLTKKQREKILTGQWRVENSWSQLAQDAGFSKRYFNQQYKFLCAYAHSSRLSIIQIQQTKEYAMKHEMAKASISTCMVVLAKFMHDYIHIIPELNGFINDSETYPIIGMWKMVGENL